MWLANLIRGMFTLASAAEQPGSPVVTPPMAQAMVNRQAFLTLVATSEGTAGIGDQGYNALFGGLTFVGYTDHPRKATYIPRLKIYTTAAGRYQVLEHVYDSYKKTLGLPDFSPASQDKIALQLIKEREALDDVDAGRILPAMRKCSNIWASFIGNNYGQPKTPIPLLTAAYSKAGGKYEDTRTLS